MKSLKLGFWVLFTLGFLVVAVALIGQNDEPISVMLFNYASNSHPKWLVLMFSALVGALLASLFFIFELIILETKNVRLRRTNQKLERALLQATGGTNGTGTANREPALEISSVTAPKLSQEEV